MSFSIFWFRRDLRLEDNVGFLAALKSGTPVMPIFIFDVEILEKLSKKDVRVTFIYSILQEMRKELGYRHNSSIGIYFGKPEEIFKNLIKQYAVQKVYANHDYEPYAIKRDKAINTILETHGIKFKTYKDQVIFEKNEVVKKNREPYVVFTPYSKKWKSKFSELQEGHLLPPDTKPYLVNLAHNTKMPNVTLADMGFEAASIPIPDYAITPTLLGNYQNTRDYPANENGTSHLGPHLRFGTVSIRKVMRIVIKEQSETFLNELIWREFFMQILWHFPHTTTHAFKKKYDRITWRNHEDEFEKWKNGRTGYALVDAGMRQLNQTGYMHNRVRMLVASFLCKHLLIDWRWGEAYFAEKLLDYELSSNVGNWQWAAGSGVDAAPYFRIFNPTLQIVKFDKDKEYINRWIPELQTLEYPAKMVAHKEARERCLKAFKAALH